MHAWRECLNLNEEQPIFGSLRAKLVLAPLGMPKWVWPSMNRYRMFYVQTSTLPPSMHGKLTEHGRCCISPLFSSLSWLGMQFLYIWIGYMSWFLVLCFLVKIFEMLSMWYSQYELIIGLLVEFNVFLFETQIGVRCLSSFSLHIIQQPFCICNLTIYSGCMFFQGGMPLYPDILPGCLGSAHITHRKAVPGSSGCSDIAPWCYLDQSFGGCFSWCFTWVALLWGKLNSQLGLIFDIIYQTVGNILPVN